MDVRAAVAIAAGKALEISTIQLEGPREGEVLVEIKATGVCHTDEFTLSGADPEGLFPAILGHEGAGVVVDIGRGVTSVKKGDHVIPLYTPECRQCKSCLSRKTNLCTAIRATQGKGLMPDGTSRFSKNGKPIFHYMGCSTFANYTVMPEIALSNERRIASNFECMMSIRCTFERPDCVWLLLSRCERATLLSEKMAAPITNARGICRANMRRLRRVKGKDIENPPENRFDSMDDNIPACR